MNSHFNRLKKIIGNSDAFVMSDDDNPYKVSEYFDTGCYILNCALSDGDIYKGMPLGKRIGIAGPSGVAKSYFIMSIVKNFLQQKENSYAIVFETEGATINEMCDSLSVDKDRVLTIPVFTVEDFRTQIIRLLDDIKLQQEEAQKKKEAPPYYILCLDSLGMLATSKESADARAGNEKQDMTRAKIIKSIFRLITLPLSMTKTPLLIANHTYGTQELYSKQVTSGGEGYKYACDVSLILSKAQDKEGTVRSGSIITLNVDKSRFIYEGQKFKVNLSFNHGVHKFSNLISLAEELGVIKKEGHSFILPNGDKVKSKELKRDIEKHFNKDVLDILQVKIKGKCGFGGDDELELDGDDEDE